MSRYNSVYDAIPIHYCKSCGSLAVIRDNNVVDHCNDCKNTLIGKSSIESWEIWYEKNYGKKYINK